MKIVFENNSNVHDEIAIRSIMTSDNSALPVDCSEYRNGVTVSEALLMTRSADGDIYFDVESVYGEHISVRIQMRAHGDICGEWEGQFPIT